MPDNTNLLTPKTGFPKELLEVRFATGKYGEVSGDTLQLNFDGGWALCVTMQPVYDTYGEFGFDVQAYVPVTPFGSYRDQVDWAPEE
jgi:hypothetical protein